MGTGIGDLEFYVSEVKIELKFNDIEKFNYNKNMVNNIIDTIGRWKYNHKCNGIYINTKDMNICCSVITETINLLNNYIVCND